MSTLSNMDNGLMAFETLDDDDFAKIKGVVKVHDNLHLYQNK